MRFPPLNAPMIMFKHVKDLLLPLDVYAAARRMGKLLEIDFSFPSTTGRHIAASSPEVQIISLIVIATKLSHPFDDIVRVPEKITDPAVLTVDWGFWRDAIAEETPKGLRKGDEINIAENDVFAMKPAEMDQYLDWYQRTWIDDRDPKLPEQILDLFPIDELPPDEQTQTVKDDTILEKIKEVQKNLIVHKPVPPAEHTKKSNIVRPGSFYKFYRTVDDLDEKAKRFYQKAADNAGLPLEMLLRAVFSLESQLQALVAKTKRKEMEEQYARLALEEDAMEE